MSEILRAPTMPLSWRLGVLAQLLDELEPLLIVNRDVLRDVQDAVAAQLAALRSGGETHE